VVGLIGVFTFFLERWLLLLTTFLAWHQLPLSPHTFFQLKGVHDPRGNPTFRWSVSRSWPARSLLFFGRSLVPNQIFLSALLGHLGLVFLVFFWFPICLSPSLSWLSSPLILSLCFFSFPFRFPQVRSFPTDRILFPPFRFQSLTRRPLFLHRPIPTFPTTV